MAQEDKKNKKDFRNIPGMPNGEDKSSKKGPKFSIYWIYAVIAVVLIGANFISGTPDAVKTTELAFRQNMLATGDVEKLDLVKNKELVRVYIKPESLKKPYFESKVKKNSSGFVKGPQFEFSVTDWESFNAAQSAFFKDSTQNKLGVEKVPETVANEGEWFGPIANTIVTITPTNMTDSFETFSTLITDAKTIPPNINFETSVRYFPTSLLVSFLIIFNTYITPQNSPHNHKFL